MGNSSESQAITDRLDTIITLLAGMADTQPRLSYNARQAAAITGLHPSRIYQLIADGQLDKVPNLGTTKLIPHASLARRFGGES